MRPDLLDVALLVVALLFAVSGYRRGLLVGVLSFVGFLGGGLLGARYAPALTRTPLLADLPPAVVGVAVVFLAATLGQLLLTGLGSALRNRVSWRPIRLLDAMAGAAVSVVGLLLVAWLVGTAVASSPLTGLAYQVRRSEVLTAVDSLVPGASRGLFAGFRQLLDDRGFPQVFGDLVPSRSPAVAAPDPSLVAAVVRRAGNRVLKVTGVAASCARRIEGSGFVFARERVMTNAHVVAGVVRPTVTIGARRLPARVVLYDAGRDVAVLSVPGLTLAPLVFAGPARTGADAVVLGFPQDGPLQADAARVRGTQRARGSDIYQRASVVREIYALRSRVRPGNSGGPLLAPDGSVYGVVFAAAADDPSTGYALTAREVAGDAQAGRRATAAVGTSTCD